MTPSVPTSPASDSDFPVFDPLAPLPTGRLLIEASAGTGKTHTISTLAVRFVAERSDVGAAGLCVVSFTEAATTELRGRIRQRMVEVADLLESGAATTDPLVVHYRAYPAAERNDVVKRLRRATEEFDRALITTIHGFCSRVLTALGVPVGAVGAGGGEVDEVVNDLLVTTARPLAVAVDGAALQPERFGEAVRTLVQLPLATLSGVDVGSPAAVDPSVGPPADAPDLLRRSADAAMQARRLVAERRRMGTTRSFDSLLTDVRALLDSAAGATAATRAAVRAALANVAVVMVDEFQDTDGLQWSIFDNAFPVGRCPMVLVGDPKQSIYRFRSAELSAYLAARSSDAMDVATLGTNYRSDPGLLAGIERLYVAPATTATYPLGSDAEATPSVHFRPVEAHHTGRRLHGMDVGASVEFRVLDPEPGHRAGGTDDSGPPPAGQLPTGVRRAMVADDVARQVSRLLRAAHDDARSAGGSAGGTAVRIDEPGGGQRDLRPSDIAVLVGTNAEALAVAQHLAGAGVAAATATTNSVLDGAAAWQWRVLLAALVRPASPGPVRAAALGWFIGHPAAPLADPDTDLGSVHELLAHWGTVLRRGGPIALLGETRRSGLADRLLVRTGGERRITDLEHIAELLQSAVGARPTGALEVAEALDALSLGAETEAAVDQMARRIDRDDDAVQILTVHRAKGLEFPVVLCPFLWPARSMRGVPHAAVPDGSGGVQRQVWTPWLTGRSVASARVGELGDFRLTGVTRSGVKVASRLKLEHLEEADRLTYVALTRAAAHLVVWWVSPADGAGRGGKDQALARLLSHATGIDTATLVASPSRVAALASEHVAVSRVDPDAPGYPQVAPGGVIDLERARYTRDPRQRRRRWSYSRLSEQLGDHGGPPAGGGPRSPASPRAPVADPDDGRVGGADERPVAELADTARDGPVPATDPFAGLGGTRFGTMIHGVLEQADFTSAALGVELAETLEQAMTRWRTAPLAPTVAAGLAAALEVPLGGPLRATDTRLVALPGDHRLNELRFDLALGATSLGDLAGLLAADPAVSGPFGGWLDRLASGPGVEGMLTGSIDLVGSFDGEQYFVADHKTNLLAGGYGADQLVGAMADHDYPLQATLYLVALHRFLSQRLGGYDPERHLAGAAYLFVRGMAADGSGTYWFTPKAATVVAVSDLLAAGVTP